MLPKHFWFWSSNFFSPNKNTLSNDLTGFFFKKSSRVPFSGYLDKGPHKVSFPTKKFVKWVWY